MIDLAKFLMADTNRRHAEPMMKKFRADHLYERLIWHPSRAGTAGLARHSVSATMD
jgi:hypothetical protein